MLWKLKPKFHSPTQDDILDYPEWRSWSTEDVCKWFKEDLGISGHSRKLKKEKVNGKRLSTITEKELENLGFDKEAHRSKILRKIERLRNNFPDPSDMNEGEAKKISLSEVRNYVETTIFEKKLEKLPIAKDLPRLLRRTHIFERQTDGSLKGSKWNDIERNGNKGNESESESESEKEDPDQESDMEEEAKQTTTMDLLFYFFQQLSEMFPDSMAVESKEEFAQELESLSAKKLSNFLMLNVKQPSPVATVLRFLNQSVMTNAVLQLKQALRRRGISFKDGKGWVIWIIYDPSTDGFDIAHKRRELIYSRKQGSMVVDSEYGTPLEFYWELIFSVSSKNKELRNIQMRKTDHTWLSNSLNNQAKENLLKGLEKGFQLET
eukprot:gb/GECH01002552.1/.p1 GENE.gb/GECH01002552.1/~~gb/GECH01002552.1/.p1  ORF type:complete len:379 (+),score=95.45 gb/GECH01002552.1/:1-1137(+)